MSSDDHGSVTLWMADLRLGATEVAQQELWDRYFQRLVALARMRLGNTPRGCEDEEDVALSVLHSFFDGVARGRFPRLHDRDNLWSLLAKLTARQAINQRKRQLAQKRGGQAVQITSDTEVNIAQLIETEITPDFIVSVNEECRRLMDALPDDTFRLIARRKLEGWTNAEISAELGVVERTVERKLSIIRSSWLPELS